MAVYKTILVHVDPDDAGSADRIECAAHLARDYRAKLVGVAARLPEPVVEVLAAGMPIFAGGMITGEPQELDKWFDHAHAGFARATSDLGIETGWRTVVDFPTATLIKLAAAADLLIVGSHAASVPPADRSIDLGELVMRAGRPVLIVPPGVAKIELGGAVMAWKATTEARRALADAIPLLAQIERVVLAHVHEAGDEKDTSLSEAEGFLHSHCIGASAQKLPSGGSVAARIIELAGKTHSGLIVAGAYGHARLREWAFGGATRDLLHLCPVPCLLSH